MTLAEIAKKANHGVKFKRPTSAREFKFGEHHGYPKGKPYIVVDHYGMTAALFSDDLMADDWDVVP